MKLARFFIALFSLYFFLLFLSTPGWRILLYTE